MTTLDDFTPLESLLLFQSLHAWGVEPESFVRISERLNKSSLIEDVPKERFKPASLQELYLKLLKAEAKQELQEALDREDIETHGEPISPSRKRKAPSPALPTVEEAAHHNHLVPKLVDKLYSRYVEQTAREIEEEEELYDELVAAATAEDEHNKAKSRPDPQQREEEAVSSDGNAGAWSKYESQNTPSRPDPSHSALVPGAISDDEPKSNYKPESRLKIDPHRNNTLESQATLTGVPDNLHLILPQATKSSSGSAPPSMIVPTDPLSQKPSNIVSASKLSSDGINGVNQLSPSSKPTPTPSNVQHLASGADLLGSPSPQVTQLHKTNAASRSAGQQVLASDPSSSTRFQSATETKSGSSLPRDPAQHSQTPQAPPKGGVVLPPFQLTQQTSGIQLTQHPQTPGGASASPRSTTGHPNLLASTSTRPTSVRPRMTAQAIADANTPSRLYGPGVVVTPGSSTGWRTDGHFATTPYIQRPRSESISSISDTEESALRTKSTAKKSRPGALPKTELRLQDAVSGEIGGLKNLKRSRAASRASSTKGHVKNETETLMADENEVTDVDAIPSGNIIKRKRTQADTDESTVPAPQSPKKGYILATRNFSRSTGSLMNNITSHKHASLFANPIRAKDAEGYSEVVYRPQDLKTIRAMISAGTKAVQAAAGEALQSSPGGGSTSNELILPISADLIPPKAIVNADQLEKEIMRIFANAVMFNPGDEDLVKEAREMSETVEKLITEWRETVLGEHHGSTAVKRLDLDTEDEGDTSSVAPGPAKRRRL